MWHVWKVILIPYFTVTPFHCFFHHHSVTCTHFLSLSFPLLSPPALPHSPGYSGHPHLPSPPTPASRVHYLLPPAPPAIHSVPHLLPPRLSPPASSCTSTCTCLSCPSPQCHGASRQWLRQRDSQLIIEDWHIVLKVPYFDWFGVILIYFFFFSSKNWEVNGDFFTVF